MKTALILVAAALLVAISSTARSAAQQPAANVWTGIFTGPQAARGKASYDGVCARCHGAQLMGGGADGGPTLKGSDFLGHWTGETLASLYVKIRDTMPQTGAGTVSEDVKIEILAYLLQQNGFPAGSPELKVDLTALDEVFLTQKSMWDGVFTAAQADRGKAAAEQGRCTGCHGPDLAGT